MAFYGVSGTISLLLVILYFIFVLTNPGTDSLTPTLLQLTQYLYHVTRLVPTEIIVIVLVKELGKSVLFWIIRTNGYP